MTDTRTFTVRQLIAHLTFYPMDAKVCICCSKANDVLPLYAVHFVAPESVDRDLDDDDQPFVSLEDVEATR